MGGGGVIAWVGISARSDLWFDCFQFASFSANASFSFKSFFFATPPLDVPLSLHCTDNKIQL